MTQLSIKVKGELVRKGLQDFSAEVPKVGRRQIYNTLIRIQRRMSKSGKRPTYPIKWDSDKQRKAFFASDGFGRGIPSVRTFKYEDAWKVTPSQNGYVLENASGYAQYLSGDAYGQVHSGIHKGRYENLRDVVDDETKKLPDDVEKELVIVARRKGLDAT